MSLAFCFYSPTKCLVGNIGGDGNRDYWSGSDVNAKQEKHCVDRFDVVETGTTQISGTMHDRAGQGS